MKLMTNVDIEPCQSFLIDHRRPILMLGSCFSDSIGVRLRERLFNVDINPFGTLYNPVSILRAVERIVNLEYITEDDIFEDNGVWHTWAHHSSFSSTNPDELIAKANARIDKAHDEIHNGATLVITYGTAYYYELVDSGKVVANCHKQPSWLFERKMCDDFGYLKLIGDMTQCPIVVTVSPIRHLADGAHGNTLSKARLHQVIDSDLHCNDTFHNRCSYFPAFEIMMDELRDYRFYAPDMVHPSEQAVDYIYDAFERTYCDPLTQEISAQALSLCRRINHRLLIADDPRNASFVEETNRQIEELISKYPFLADRINRIKNDK